MSVMNVLAPPPAVAHRFIVSLFLSDAPGPLKLIPSPLDIAFQTVSGLELELDIEHRFQGGANTSAVLLPRRVQPGRLVFERGLVMATPLMETFSTAFDSFKIAPITAIIILLDPDYIPIATWATGGALPVKLALGDLDAMSNKVLINRFELAYGNLTWIA